MLALLQLPAGCIAVNISLLGYMLLSDGADFVQCGGRLSGWACISAPAGIVVMAKGMNDEGCIQARFLLSTVIKALQRVHVGGG